MKSDMVKYYYKDLGTGVEMQFTKTDQWGWAVGFINTDFLGSINYDGIIPWPTLSEEEQKIVDENYKRLYEILENEDD